MTVTLALPGPAPGRRGCSRSPSPSLLYFKLEQTQRIAITRRDESHVTRCLMGPVLGRRRWAGPAEARTVSKREKIASAHDEFTALLLEHSTDSDTRFGFNQQTLPGSPPKCCRFSVEFVMAESGKTRGFYYETLTKIDVIGIVLHALKTKQALILRASSKYFRDNIPVAWKRPQLTISKEGSTQITAEFLSSFKGDLQIENRYTLDDMSRGWFQALMKAWKGSFKVSCLKIRVRHHCQLIFLEEQLRRKSLPNLAIMFAGDLNRASAHLELLRLRLNCNMILEIAPLEATQNIVSAAQRAAMHATVESLDFR